MKRLMALMIALVMVAFLAACGQGDTPDSDPTTQPMTLPTTEPTTEPATAPTSEPATAPSTEPAPPATEPSDEVTEPSSEVTEPSDAVTEPTQVDEVTLRGSYSVSDTEAIAARDDVVAMMNGAVLTNGQLQVFYWQSVYDFLNEYGYYAIYYGLDYTKPLDTQEAPGTGRTWQQTFLADALSDWHSYTALALLAEKEGITLSAELQKELDELQAQMAKYAEEDGFDSVDAMIQADMGPGCTFEDYEAQVRTYYLGYEYFSRKHEQFAQQITMQQMEQWFEENSEKLASGGITKDSGYNCDVRHILVLVDEKKTDADWENCRAAAQALLDQWLAGEATEESFAAMAREHSEDPGSRENGGMYQNLNDETSFVQPFKDWYLDENRRVGDYGLVRTDYGYHIMYYSAEEPQWQTAARNGLLSDASAKLLADAMEAYPMEVFYQDIALGVVDLNKE